MHLFQQLARCAGKSARSANFPMDGLEAMACVKIHREVGTRGLFFALLFGEAKSSLKFH
jgi:hypothetical protein